MTDSVLNPADAWTEELLAGETRTYAEFNVSQSRREAPSSAGKAELARIDGRLVGAQQLELARRVNAVRGAAGQDKSESSAIARAIVTAPLSGRGLPELPTSVLLAPEASPVPEAEFLRVAVSVLADRAAALAPVTAPQSPAHVTGDPHQCRSSSGRAPRGRRYVLAAPLADLLHSAWIERSAHPQGPTWHAWLESWHQRGELPPQIDLVRQARGFSSLSRVYVVWSPPLARGIEVAAEDRLGAHAVEVLRLVSRSLGAVVPPGSHAGHTEHVRRWLAPFAAPTLALPEALAGWVASQQARQKAELSRYRALGAQPGGVRAEDGELPKEVPGELPSVNGALEIATRVLAAGID